MPRPIDTVRNSFYGEGKCVKWRTGLEAKPHRARKFYGTLTAVMLAGLGLNFVPIDPIKALVWAAVINGIVAPPIMVVLMLMANKPEVMKEFVISKRLKWMGWLATAVMLVVALAAIAGLFFGA